MYCAFIVGNRFASICKAGIKGNVHSIFNKTINIKINEHGVPISLLTLGRRDVDISPSSVITSMRNDQSWQSLNIKIGSRVVFTQDKVYFGDTILVDHIDHAKYWQPAAAIDLQGLPPLRYEEIKDHCNVVSLYIKICAKNNIVYTLITRLSEIHDQVYTNFNNDIFLQQFLQGIRALQQAIRNSLGQCVSNSDFDFAVNELLGLGEGLTPSGDDFLAGVLNAMHFVQKVFGQECRALPLLADAVHRNMGSRTNQISQHFLRYAEEGMWSSATEEFLRALFQFNNKRNGALYQAVDKKLSYGATSGMDEIFGVMFGVCEAIKLFEG